MSTLRRLPGLTLDELTQELGSRTRAVETLRWLCEGNALREALPESLPSVSQKAWTRFRERSGLVSPLVAEKSAAPDGTAKYALTFGDVTVETVRIPSSGRSTVCVSSQAGCTRRCSFCATKELGFLKNLTAEEMVAQYLLARSEAPAEQPAKNVVFMGMGEPLDNVEEVLRAVTVLIQSPAPQLKEDSVTVSTSGVVPGMRRFLEASPASLALSLNATTDEVRARLMPHTKTWPLGALLDTLRYGLTIDPRRHYFIGYVLFEGVNDADADADRLAGLFEGLPARINLIPHNPWPGSALTPSSRERVLAFHERVSRQGQRCLVRWPKGQAIAAACGQLVLQRGGTGFVGAR